MLTSRAVDLRDTPNEAVFRAEVRSWLAENAPDGLEGLSSPAALRVLEDADVAAARAWSAQLADAGYAGLTWPAEFGGAGAPESHHAFYLEESARASAPQHLAVIGLGLVGPTIITHGTDEQKARFLAKILRADEIWCQGFSEPGAGSDLAGVRTRADAQDGGYRVNGQKIWSSFAQIADFCLLLARTDPGSERHAGLTMFLLDMSSPGVDVRPIREASGDAVFNEIFLADVEVPESAVLGGVGEGWRVAMTTLLHERATLGFALVGALEAQLGRVVALARERGVADARLRDLLAREAIELEALKLTVYRSLTEVERTGAPGPEGSVTKLRWSESNQRLTALGLELLGPEAPVADESMRYELLRSRANSIEAGTSEVLRNIIAERVLGLPRSR
jgi:alkylation response protein AidB-like acyl-CoA dehydrogenase